MVLDAVVAKIADVVALPLMITFPVVVAPPLIVNPLFCAPPPIVVLPVFETVNKVVVAKLAEVEEIANTMPLVVLVLVATKESVAKGEVVPRPMRPPK